MHLGIPNFEPVEKAEPKPDPGRAPTSRRAEQPKARTRLATSWAASPATIRMDANSCIHRALVTRQMCCTTPASIPNDGSIIYEAALLVPAGRRLRHRKQHVTRCLDEPSNHQK